MYKRIIVLIIFISIISVYNVLLKKADIRSKYFIDGNCRTPFYELINYQGEHYTFVEILEIPNSIILEVEYEDVGLVKITKPFCYYPRKTHTINFRCEGCTLYKRDEELFLHGIITNDLVIKKEVFLRLVYSLDFDGHYIGDFEEY